MSPASVTDRKDRPLLNRNFLLLLQSSLISQMGTQIALVTTGFWLKKSTDSANLVGLLATVSAIPVLLMGPLAGAAADRWSRRKSLISWDILCGFVSWSFVLLIGSQRFALNQVLEGIFIGNFLLSTANVFAGPACNAMYPDVVEASALPKGLAFLQASRMIAIICGQTLGGVLLTRFPPHALFGVDGTSYFISACALFFIRAPRRVADAVTPARSAGNIWREIGEGLVYIWRYRGLRALMLASIPLHLFTTPILVFLPFYTTNALHQPLSRYGYLLSTFSIGMLLGFILGGRTKGFRHVHALLFACVIGNSLTTFALSGIHELWMAMILLFVSGVLAGMMGLLSINAILAKTDQNKRGRVVSILMMIAQGLTPLAMSLMGLVGDRLHGNVQFLYAVLAGLLLLTSLALFFNSDLKHFFDEAPALSSHQPAR